MSPRYELRGHEPAGIAMSLAMSLAMREPMPYTHSRPSILVVIRIGKLITRMQFGTLVVLGTHIEDSP